MNYGWVVWGGGRKERPSFGVVKRVYAQEEWGHWEATFCNVLQCVL